MRCAIAKTYGELAIAQWRTARLALTRHVRQRCAGACGACGSHAAVAGVMEPLTRLLQPRASIGRAAGSVERGGDCQSAAGLQTVGQSMGKRRLLHGPALPPEAGGWLPRAAALESVDRGRLPATFRAAAAEGGGRAADHPPPSHLLPRRRHDMIPGPRLTVGGAVLASPWRGRRMPGPAPPPRLTVGGAVLASLWRMLIARAPLGGVWVGGREGVPQTTKGSPRWMVKPLSSRVADGAAPPCRGSPAPPSTSGARASRGRAAWGRRRAVPAATGGGGWRSPGPRASSCGGPRSVWPSRSRPTRRVAMRGRRLAAAETGGLVGSAVGGVADKSARWWLRLDAPTANHHDSPPPSPRPACAVLPAPHCKPSSLPLPRTSCCLHTHPAASPTLPLTAPWADRRAPTAPRGAGAAAAGLPPPPPPPPPRRSSPRPPPRR